MCRQCFFLSFLVVLEQTVSPMHLNTIMQRLQLASWWRPTRQPVVCNSYLDPLIRHFPDGLSREQIQAQDGRYSNVSINKSPSVASVVRSCTQPRHPVHERNDESSFHRLQRRQLLLGRPLPERHIEIDPRRRVAPRVLRRLKPYPEGKVIRRARKPILPRLFHAQDSTRPRVTISDENLGLLKAR